MNLGSKLNNKYDDAFSQVSSISSKKIIKRDSPSNKSTQQSVSSRNTHNCKLIFNISNTIIWCPSNNFQ